MSPFHVRSLGCLCVILPALLAGCTYADYGGLQITQQSTPPTELDGAGIEITSRGINLQVGVAVLVKALPVSKNDQPYTANDELKLSSDNPSVLGVFEADRTTRVVLTGTREGSSCLLVSVNDEQVDCFPVNVLAQPIEDGE